MKISTILDHAESGHIALPQFQRGYVWRRGQVRALFNSMYRGHPIGGLLVWVTDRAGDAQRGKASASGGVTKLLLDGQQRITSIYGVVRGCAPSFFEGDARAFTGLRFHIENEVFEFFQPVKMRDDPLWIDVTSLMQKDGMERVIGQLTPQHSARLPKFWQRLARLMAIGNIELHVEEITDSSITMDVVVEIFNRVNSGGTKLSKGDLAMARICADNPSARDNMNEAMAGWEHRGFRFTMDWLLRCVNAVYSGKAKFDFLRPAGPQDIDNALKQTRNYVDQALDLIDGRLGLDHKRVLFSPFALPVMVRYLYQKGGSVTAVERDKLLYWFVHAGMWGRFSGSTETKLEEDYSALADSAGLDVLIQRLRSWRGHLRIMPDDFSSWGIGARFYPVLYMLTRMNNARNLCDGIPVRQLILGSTSRLEVHHIFPKKHLYEYGYNKQEVNAVANFCLLPGRCNRKIGSRRPEDYMPEVARNHPGALESQWIPMDPALWRIERYRDFLEARRVLLAANANRYLNGLLHEDPATVIVSPSEQRDTVEQPIGGIASKSEEEVLANLNDWVKGHGLEPGHTAYEFSDPSTGTQRAIFDLAWPRGVQPGLTRRVAVLLDEPVAVHAAASEAGFRVFASAEAFRRHIENEVLASSGALSF